MPPSDSQTPAVELSDEEIEEWRKGLDWERALDLQREHRLLREGIFWHDPTLDGLSDDDRMWEIIKMSFRQVAQVLDSVGLVHYFEYFLERGILGAKHLRLLTRKYVQTKMPKICPDDREAIIEAASNCMKDEDMRFFEARYGDVDRFVLDCQHARRFLSEKLLHEQWMIDQYDLTAPLHTETNSFFTKWTVPKADAALFDECDDWVAASSCDGLLFLWPVLPGDRTPPVVRCKQLHSAPCVDFTMDWTRMQAVTCGIDNKVNLYDLKDDRVMGALRDGAKEGGNDSQAFLCVDSDLDEGRAALGTNFGSIKVLDLQRMQLVSSLLGHQDHCRALQMDSELQLLVSCSWDSYVHLYDLRSSKLIHRFKGHNGTCTSLSVDFQKMVALTSAAEYRFLLWDLEERKLMHRYESPGHNVNCLSLNAQNGKLATGSDDGLVKIWNLDKEDAWERSIDCKHYMTLAMDVDWVRGHLVTASWDYNVDMWDLSNGEHLHHFFKPRRCMTQVRLKKFDRLSADESGISCKVSS